MRKTKIVCTMGPTTDNPEILRKLMLAGMNVGRINFSHGNYIDQDGRVQLFKKIREELGLPIPLLLDTQGPEIRIGKFKDEEAILENGKTFTLLNDDVLGDNTKVSITYKNLYNEIDIGRTVLINDGTIELKVKEIVDKDIVCEVIQGGKLTNRKSINIPDFIVNLPGITEKDVADIKYGIEAGFDYIAASFVRKPQDILDIKKVLKENNGEHIKIIAKIENREGIDNFDKILEVSDGIMVARGDLGVEVPMEDLPYYQQLIINKCRQNGKIAIVATEMLESMKKNIRPTRAEVTDISYAVATGADAVMLSGETTTGKNPIEAVKYMAKVCESTEKHIEYVVDSSWVSKDIKGSIASSVVNSANLLSAKMIIVATMTGKTASVISNLRSKSIIIANCISESVARSLALNWGVYTSITTIYNTTDEIVDDAIDYAINSKDISKDDIVIITGGFPQNKDTNFMKIEKI